MKTPTPHLAALAFILVQCCAASAQPELSHSGLACVVRLELPHYPKLARQARMEGTARITFDISRGKPHNVVIEGVPDLFHLELRSIVAKSAYAPSCSAHQMKLVVRFEIVGDRTAVPETSAAFEPPGTFIIRTSPAELQLSRAGGVDRLARSGAVPQK